jgi:uridine kinase
MGKEIKIVILGDAASGKSAIARLVKEALQQNGFTNIDYQAELDDVPMEKRLDINFAEKRLNAVSKKVSVVRIFEINSKINPTVHEFDIKK